MEFARHLCLVTILAAGCNPAPVCEQARLDPLEEIASYAVVTTDDSYVSTAISLLDDEGELLTSAWIESGSVEVRLSAALSGDIVLPTAPLFENTLGYIDRSGANNITLISMPDASSIQQIRTTLPMTDGETAFESNSQDAVMLDERVFLSRAQPNLDPEAPELDRGNDLLIVDSGSHEAEDRIALDGLNTEEDGVLVYARPYRMVRLGDRIAIGLARLSYDWMTAGSGMIAIVNPIAQEVTGVSLEQFANCTDVVPVANDSARVIVACAGATFGDEEDRRGGAGLAIVHVDEVGVATVEHTWQASDGAPVVTHGPISLGRTRVLGVAMGNIDEQLTDRLVVVDLATGQYDIIYTSTESFVLGRGTMSLSGETLFVPDATSTKRSIQRWRGGATLTLEAEIKVSPCRQFGPREIRPL